MAKKRSIKKLAFYLAIAFSALIPATATAVVDGAIEHEKNSSSFDHLGTGFPLIGAHAQLDCKACHTEGIFEDLATQCADCHNGSTAPGITPNHAPVTQSCDTCHNVDSFVVATSTTMDHSVLMGQQCSSCHDGITASGKHPTHLETDLECDSCHNTNAWASAGFDHSTLTGQACVSCHNGTDATGKNSTHIATTDLCGACHTTSSWIPITTVNHAQVMGACSSCHDGITATGKGLTHIETTEECNACHTTEAWVATFDHSTLTSSQSCIDCHNGTQATGKTATHINSTDNCGACHATGPTPWIPVAPANVDHNEVIGTCTSCHNGTTATGKPADHIDTTAECDTCHSVGAWLPAVVDHTSFVNNCIDCHNGTNASGKSNTHIDTSNLCDSCHARFPANWTPVDPTAVDHAQVNGTCASCHNGTAASGKGTNHITSSDNCDACHAAGPTPWQPVDPANVNHNEVTGTCASCHDGTIASGKSTTHISSSDNCDACHAPGPTPWQPVDPAGVDHNEVTGTCASCHDGTIASGKSTTHIASSDNCATCHAPGPTPWQPVDPASVDHNEVTGTCASCHDGTIASGKSTSHITTSDNCDACHAPGPTPWQPVDPTNVDHNEVTGTCASCHDGTIASGKSATHISSSDNCDACHAPGPAPWQPVDPANVDHNEVIGTCSSCHDGTIATGQDVDHISTTEECDTCHTVGAWLPAVVDHSGFSNNCIDCHDGTIASGKSNTHINSSDQCDSCHTVFPATWAPVQPTAVDHTQVIGTCISCHDGTIASGKSATHITSSDNCDACHAPGPTPWQPVAPADVNHNEVTGTCVSCHDGTIASGKSTSHISSSDNCDACHAPGPTPWQPVAPASVDHNEVTGTCSSCHDGTIASGKSTSHITTSDNCDACHAPGPTPWQPVATTSVDHNEVTGSCTSCHDGTIASGKSTSHITTSDNCDACHAPGPTPWQPVAPADVDHNEVTGTCTSCHDGTIASGKGTSHITSSDNCAACHQPGPTPWQPVAPADVDHNEVIGTCSSCHDGTIATGQDANHIATTEECDTCHTVGAWLPAAVDHSGFAGNCIDCHDGTTASGKSTTHINTTEACDSCHTVFPATWAPLQASAVDHTQVIGTCISCHDGTIASGKSTTHITSSDVCDACHAPGPTPWAPVAPVSVDHNEVTGTCASCHDGTTASGKSTSHITTSDNCDACHAPGPTPWAPVAPASVDHNEVTGTCASCHDGTTASGKSTSHITTSDNCDACHAPGPTPWQPVAPANVDHNEVTGTCASCHDGTTASGKGTSHITSSDNCATCHQPGPTPWQPVAPADVDHNEVIGTCSSCHDNTIATGKPTGHLVTTEECDNCHTVGAWLPAAVDHSGFAGNCIDCHDGTTASGKSTTHIDSTDACDSCHAVFPATWAPLQPSAIDHTQVIGTCISCHDSTIASGKSATHITSSDNCDACHAPGPTPWAPVAPSSVDHNEVTGTCVSCHDGTIASGKSATHITSSDNCDACHAPGPTPWAPVVPTSVDHNEVTGTCASCHDGTIASGKSTSHIATSDNCDTCHAPGPTPWAPVTPTSVDHNEVLGTCASCHDGNIASGKSTSHIATSDNCDACHAPGPTPWTPVAPASVDHNEVTGTCASCHDGTIASGKSTSHITTSDNCTACHQPGPTPWLPLAPADVDHNEVIGTCSSCHDNTIATGKPTGHLVTTDECDSCHTVGAWLPAAVDHSGFAGNCIDCHDGTQASGKSTTHINSTDACDSCHAVFPATWAPVQPSSVDHTQVIGTCFSCHDGTTASGKSTSHITSSDNCDACHAVGPTPWAPVAPDAVDHNEVTGTCISCHDGTTASGKGTTHIASSDNCDACHAPGPTPWAPVAPTSVDHNEVIGTCASCHDGTTAIGKSGSHITTTDVCIACHAPAPTPWQPVAPADVDHNQVLGTCVSCHDGNTASGKSNTHMSTSDNCDACHAPGPTPWQPVAPTDVDHNEVIGTCVSCHDGTTAIGKSNAHINSTDNCAACHAPAPTPWQPVAPNNVDHNEVIGVCSSCHDNTTATGKPTNHIQTNDECDICHSTDAWLPAGVDHSSFVNNCIDCHNGTDASGKTATHINTSDLCDACHQPFPATWAPVASSAVDHNQVNGTCVSCHDGTTAIGKSATHINTTDVCDACHAPGPTPWTPVAPSAVDHNEVVGTCASCHDGTTAIGKGPTHINTTDACEACHQPGPTPWAPIAPADVDHNEVLGTCASCHDGVIATGQDLGHVPTSDDCGVCHQTTGWLPAAVDHTNITTNCIRCHDGVSASGKTAAHLNTSDVCEACHEKHPATWTPVAPTNVDHNEVNGTCVSCHNGTDATGKSNTHISSSDNCDACHAPGPTPWAPVIAVDHNEILGSCASCHDGTTATGKPGNHINSSDNCDACHATAPTPWAPVASSSVDHNEVIGTCASCHNNTTAVGKSASHMNTSDVCEACHAPGPIPWTPVAPSNVDHNEVIGTCVSCHDNTTAIGKGNNHINTSDNCESCHAPAPTPWAPLAPSSVDHNEVIGVCESCHDGVIAIGKGTTHISSTNNCAACHAPAPTPWTSVITVDHNEVLGSCSICHDGVTATGKPTDHIQTTAECDACHNVNAWLPAVVDHTNFANNCIDCHNGTTATGKSGSHISSTDVCDACHEKFPASWAPVPSSSVDHSQVFGTCVSCHDGTTASGKSAQHIATTDNCNACHQPGPIPWIPVAAQNVDHNEVLGTCVSCHDNSTAPGKPADHPTTTDNCEACHLPSPVPWSSWTVDHTEVTGCQSCHDGGVAQGLPRGHCPISQDCDYCHRPAPASWGDNFRGCGG